MVTIVLGKNNSVRACEHSALLPPGPLSARNGGVYGQSGVILRGTWTFSRCWQIFAPSGNRSKKLLLPSSGWLLALVVNGLAGRQSGCPLRTLTPGRPPRPRRRGKPPVPKPLFTPGLARGSIVQLDHRLQGGVFSVSGSAPDIQPQWPNVRGPSGNCLKRGGLAVGV